MCTHYAYMTAVWIHKLKITPIRRLKSGDTNMAKVAVKWGQWVFRDADASRLKTDMDVEPPMWFMLIDTFYLKTMYMHKGDILPEFASQIIRISNNHIWFVVSLWSSDNHHLQCSSLYKTWWSKTSNQQSNIQARDRLQKFPTFRLYWSITFCNAIFFLDVLFFTFYGNKFKCEKHENGNYRKHPHPLCVIEISLKLREW